MSIRIQCVVIDAADPAALARFWANALGWQITYEDSHQSVAEPPEASPEVDVCPDLLFVLVGDKKITKNRLHLDLRPSDQELEIERLIGLGARFASVGQQETSAWRVLADPEDNEFCVLPPLPPEEA
jgi:hypothetical protein